MRIGICAIAKNEELYISEWMAYHRKLGVSEFFIYENNWRAPEKLKEHYGNHFYQFDGEVMQLKAYNHCIHNASVPFDLDWCAFVDIDEYICVRDQSRSFQDVLDDYKAFPSLAINWRLFGSSGLSWDGSHDVVTRFTKCGKDLNRHVKQVINLKMMRERNILQRACFINPHCGNWAATSTAKRAVIGPFNYNDLDQVQPIELNHYAVKTWDECLAKCARGRADYSVKRNAEEFFKEHDVNEVDNTAARDFYLKESR